MNLHYFLLGSACPLLHFLGAAGLRANGLHCDPPLRFSMYYYDATLGSSSRGSGGLPYILRFTHCTNFDFLKLRGKEGRRRGFWLGGGRKGLSVSRLHERTLTISLIAVPRHSR
jgi:hypothetical protein